MLRIDLASDKETELSGTEQKSVISISKEHYILIICDFEPAVISQMKIFYVVQLGFIDCISVSEYAFYRPRHLCAMKDIFDIYR